MAKYKVLEVKDADGNVVPFEDDKGAKWDPNSEITELQVSTENAKKAVENKELEVLEAPEDWEEDGNADDAEDSDGDNSDSE